MTSPFFARGSHDYLLPAQSYEVYSMGGICLYELNTPVGVAYFQYTTSGAQIWNNTTSAWEAVPSTGTPLAQHLTKMIAYGGGGGSLSNALLTPAPAQVLNTDGAWAVYFALNAAGALNGAPADLITQVPLNSPPIFMVSVGHISR